jgi:hypothetical protein
VALVVAERDSPFALARLPEIVAVSCELRSQI